MAANKEKEPPAGVMKMLADPTVPKARRKHILKMLAMDGSDEATAVIDTISDAIVAEHGESLYAEKYKQVCEMREQLEAGPMRFATFIGLIALNGAPPRAQVVLEDGSLVFTVVADAQLAESLRCGDGVLLDPQGRALMYRTSTADWAGESAELERRIGDRRVRVKLHGDERGIFYASPALIEKLDRKEVEPGQELVVNSRQRIAYDAVPPEDGLSHYRFLVKDAVPDVNAQRDIGAPPRYIEEMSRLLWTEMTRPELRRRYRLSRCVTKLLAGRSGTGKSLSILAFWRRMYEIMSEVTGVAIEELPPRVMRLRMAEFLSPWLGMSDQNLDRFFREIEQLAEVPFVAPDGRTHRLPVLVIIEEVDGLARQRNTDHEAVFDRILTTALQRLDPTRPELRDKLILYLCTTNLASSLDFAFTRRIANTVETFTSLNRQAFAAVLRKQLAGIPLASHNGDSAEELQKRFVRDLSAWLFSPNGADQGVVELLYASSSNPEKRYKRDFLTGALIARAVQQAASRACENESQRADAPGMSFEELVAAFDDQILAVVNDLTEHNVAYHLPVPQGARVAQVRRVPQPASNPFTFQRST